MANLQEALRDPATHGEALEILRSLVERVIVRPAENGFTIELVGAIAHMVKLSAGAESLLAEPYASSVKMVAGTRNCLDLLLLAVSLSTVLPVSRLAATES